MLCWSRTRMRPSMAREERRKRRRSQRRFDTQKVAGWRPVMIWTCFAFVALSLIVDSSYSSQISIKLSNQYLKGKMRKEETSMARPMGRLMPKKKMCMLLSSSKELVWT